MSKRTFRVMDKDLFVDYSIKEYPLIKAKGISILRGNTKDGRQRLHAFVFDNDWTEKQIIDWMESNKRNFEDVVVLPDEAAAMWLSAYDEACLDGKSADQASDIAWKAVKKSWEKDKSGKWLKFDEDWQTAILGLEKPIEIFRCGCYPQFESEDNPEGRFTVEHMDIAIANFENGYHRPAAITVDHVNAGPALGWINKIFRIGERLYAIATDINPRLIEKLKAREYVNRSIEMWSNYFDNQTEKFIGPVFDRLTFLGVKKPAVKGMAIPTFKEDKDHAQPNPLLAFSVDVPELNQSMSEFIKTNNKSQSQSNPTKEGVLMELSQEQLDAKITAAKAEGKKEASILLGEQTATDKSAIAKAQANIDAQKAELDAKTKKLEEDRKALETKEANAKAAEADADLTIKATALFDELGKEGKVFPANRQPFINLYKLAARSTDKVKLSDGKEGSALDEFIQSQKAMPNIVKMGELTKKIDENNQTDEANGGIPVPDDQKDEFAEIQAKKKALMTADAKLSEADAINKAIAFVRTKK